MYSESARSLNEGDYDKGFIELLSQLTVASKKDMTRADFNNYVSSLENNQSHIVLIIELQGTVIATGTLFITQRAIRNFGKVGHIEDVVVDSKYQSRGLGKQIVTLLSAIAKDKKCYKVILNCDPKNTGFYERCGFQNKGIEMAAYFNK